VRKATITCRKAIIITLFIVISILIFAVPAFGAMTVLSESTGATDSMCSVAFGNGVFVAVGNSANIERSTDGKQWSHVQSTSGGSFLGSVTFANGIFVVVGNNGKILTSSDGQVWTDRSINSSDYYTTVELVNGKFYAVGERGINGVIICSDDGTNWSLVATLPQPSWSGVWSSDNSVTLKGIAYLNGHYVIGTNTFSTLYVSTNGTSWTQQRLPKGVGGQLESINFVKNLNGELYAYGFDYSNGNGLYTSTDGINWTREAVSGNYNDAEYANGVYYLFHDTNITYSTDGANWSTRTGMPTICKMVYGDGLYVAIGDSIATYSFDTANWTYAEAYLNSISFGASNYVAVGSAGSSGKGQIFSSQDDNSWVNRTPVGVQMPSLYGITYGAGQFVGVGDIGSDGKGSIVRSTDGVIWTVGNSGFDQSINSITFGDGQFIAISNSGLIITSNDGTNWTQCYSNNNYYLTSVAFVNSQFVAIGTDSAGNGIVLSSSDGETWQLKSDSADYNFNSVTYGQEGYIAVGYSLPDYTTVIVKSEDLTSWTVVYNNANVSGLTGVSCGDDGFLAVGYGGIILSSSDGETWNNEVSSITNDLNTVIYANGDFDIVGNHFAKMQVSLGTANTAPTFVGATTTLNVNENASATDIKDLLHVSDSDTGQTETWTQSAAPSNGGTLTITNATAASGSIDITPGGTITYQPANGYTGQETFTVQVSDGTATATRQITVTVNSAASAPTATTNPATSVASSEAMLNGTVNANGVSTTVTFEYGTSTTYGSIVAASSSPLTDSSDTAVSAALTGLQANTTYHYRVEGASAGGTTDGSDSTFTTSDSALPDMDVTSVALTGMDTSQTPFITTINVAMSDLGLDASAFTITDTTTPSAVATVTNASYANGQYTLTVSGMTYYDNYTLTVSKSGYNSYTNSDFYGTLATASDLDLVNEPNMFDTYTRALTSDGVVTIANAVYASGAVLYPGTTLYNAIDTTNGNAQPASPGDYKVIGAFVKAPDGAKSAKSLYSSGIMTDLTNDSLIDSNPNYMETVASGEAANNTSYWQTVSFAPVYMKIATKQTDGTWQLNSPADRFRIIAWYDGADAEGDCQGNLIKVTRFVMKVDYTGSAALDEAAPTVTGISPSSGPTSGGTSVTITGTNFIGATGVTIDGVPATSVSVGSATSISALTPQGTAGAKDVSVTAPGGTATGTSLFTYNAAQIEAPAATTTTASGITSSGSTLTGTVNANNSSTAVTFEYGLTTNYGSTAPADQSPVSGSSDTSVSAALTGLTPNTTYHYRVKGVNDGGTTNGLDSTFTTLAGSDTAPAFVGFTTTLTVNENAAATDLKDLLHVSDSDTGQTETWTQSAAPSNGGTLTITNATAASGSSDITPGGTITYQPANGYTGPETFTVQVSDGSATADRTISVTVNPASPTTYTLTYTAGANGSITGVTPQTVNSGASGSTVTAVANTGYHFVNWSDGVTTVTRTDSNVTGNITVTAIFAEDTTNGGGGSNIPVTPPTITGGVTDGTTGTKVSNITATVTTTADGTDTVTMNAAQTVELKQPDGTISPLTDTSKVAITTSTGAVVPIASDETIQVTSLAKGTNNNFDISYDLGNGQKIIMGTMNITVDNSGNVTLTTTLIDPYGIITDAATGKIISGVNVTLYYADTDQNKAAGKTPNTVVQLPSIDGFKPNNNADPQVSDSSGAYGYMVFPNSDYYIIATKDGYAEYTSPTISVGQDIVKWDFKMNAITVTYDGNGSTSGSVPTDSNNYAQVASVTVLGNTGNLVKNGYTFVGWNTAADGSGISYTAGSTFAVGSSNVILYAQWTANQTHTVTYNGNGDTGGSVPSDINNYTTGAAITVLGNTGNLVKTGYTFVGWNTAADGTGTSYTVGGTFTMNSSNVTLYAQWMANQTYTLTYTAGANGSIIGTTPQTVPSGASGTPVTAVPNTGYYFVYWSDGNTSVTRTDSNVINNVDVTASFAPIIISSGGHGGGGYSVPVPVPTPVPTPNPIPTPVPVTPTISVTRLSGANRIDTAIAIAKATYTGQVSDIILATADNFPDALAGSVLAYKLSAPILLVGSSSDDQNKVLDYLKNNLTTSGAIYVLGGSSAVGYDMVSQINAEGFTNITRLGGTDRYETASKIADALKVKAGTPVVLAYGENYPDALSISSVAADMQYPIFLVNGDSLTSEVAQQIISINPTKVYIIGSQGAVSQSVQDQVTKLTSLAPSNIVRLGGTDRFETSLAVAQYFDQSGKDTCIATGNNFPDALAGSVYAANANAPIILTDLTLSDDAIAYLKTRKMTGVTIFGGQSVVSKDIEQELSQILAK